MSVLSQIKEVVFKRGCCYIVLIDPDKKNKDLIQSQVEAANNADVDFLFIGGSLMMDNKFSDRVKQIKSFSNIPIILFPGNGMQINHFFDAILFMSVISGRNPQYLIGEQVITAPILNSKEANLTFPQIVGNPYKVELHHPITCFVSKQNFF